MLRRLLDRLHVFAHHRDHLTDRPGSAPPPYSRFAEARIALVRHPRRRQDEPATVASSRAMARSSPSCVIPGVSTIASVRPCCDASRSAPRTIPTNTGLAMSADDQRQYPGPPGSTAAAPSAPSDSRSRLPRDGRAQPCGSSPDPAWTGPANRSTGPHPRPWQPVDRGLGPAAVYPCRLRIRTLAICGNKPWSTSHDRTRGIDPRQLTGAHRSPPGIAPQQFLDGCRLCRCRGAASVNSRPSTAASVHDQPQGMSAR